MKQVFFALQILLISAAVQADQTSDSLIAQFCATGAAEGSFVGGYRPIAIDNTSGLHIRDPKTACHDSKNTRTLHVSDDALNECETTPTRVNIFCKGDSRIEAHLTMFEAGDLDIRTVSATFSNSFLAQNRQGGNELHFRATPNLNAGGNGNSTVITLVVDFDDLTQNHHVAAKWSSQGVVGIVDANPSGAPFPHLTARNSSEAPDDPDGHYLATDDQGNSLNVRIFSGETGNPQVEIYGTPNNRGGVFDDSESYQGDGIILAAKTTGKSDSLGENLRVQFNSPSDGDLYVISADKDLRHFHITKGDGELTDVDQLPISQLVAKNSETGAGKTGGGGKGGKSESKSSGSSGASSTKKSGKGSGSGTGSSAQSKSSTTKKQKTKSSKPDSDSSKSASGKTAAAKPESKDTVAAAPAPAKPLPTTVTASKPPTLTVAINKPPAAVAAPQPPAAAPAKPSNYHQWTNSLRQAQAGGAAPAPHPAAAHPVPAAPQPVPAKSSEPPASLKK